MGKQQKRSTKKKSTRKRPTAKQQLERIERKLPKSKRRKKLIPKGKTKLA